MRRSPQIVHRHLKHLLQQGRIQKLGSPPKVLYQIVDALPPVTYETLPQELIEYINEHYLTVKPSGKVLEGETGLIDATFNIEEQTLPYERILFIDDAVDSGATLNIIALKLKVKGVKFVCGFVVTGSLEGFEVLNEN